MRFNKLAKEQGLSVAELADKVSSLLPDANAGTEVSNEQKQQIVALLSAPSAAEHSLPPTASADPVLAIFLDLIEEETQRETPEVVVSEMIERYLADPTDLPNDSDYRTAITTYVKLVKKRQVRRQQQSLKLRSHLRTLETAQWAAVPLQLEHFYSSGPNATPSGDTLSGNSNQPQLKSAESASTTS